MESLSNDLSRIKLLCGEKKLRYALQLEPDQRILYKYLCLSARKATSQEARAVRSDSGSKSREIRFRLLFLTKTKKEK